METIALAAPTQVLVFLNGDFQTEGTKMNVESSMTMHQLLKEAAEILDITPLGITLTRAFTEDGREISSPSALESSSKVFVSAGEDFVTPEAAAAAAPTEDLVPYPSVPDSAPRATPAPSATTTDASAPSTEDTADSDEARPTTPTQGYIEAAATTTASWIGWGYGLASSYLKQAHPPTGEKLERVENAVMSRVGDYARDSAPAMRTGLRWADRQV
jgi:hypothetical protein